jgi:hypothetical protein
LARVARILDSSIHFAVLPMALGSTAPLFVFGFNPFGGLYDRSSNRNVGGIFSYPGIIGYPLCA